jgi:formamidase
MVISPGSEVEIETLDSSAGQLNAQSTVADLVALDFARVNPVTGPLFIEGAEPGDAIKITFQEFNSSGWGWTGNIPGFGLLADQFTEPALHIWKYDSANPQTSTFNGGGQVPLKPFVGTVGLAPAEVGLHSVVPPRTVGGNMDIRDMSQGTELLLPVEVTGGLLSLGDTHAAQGDGEALAGLASELGCTSQNQKLFAKFTQKNHQKIFSQPGAIAALKSLKSELNSERTLAQSCKFAALPVGRGEVQ